MCMPREREEIKEENHFDEEVEEMMDSVNKFTKGQILSAVPALSGVMPPPGTPVRNRAGSSAGSLVGSFAGAAAAALKRKHEESVGGQASGTRPRHGGQDQGGQQVAGEQPAQDNQPGQGVQGQWEVPKQRRKQCFGTSKVTVTGTGRSDWAAPVEVFVNNTSPDITDKDIKEILKLCADDAKSENEALAEFEVKDAKCLTRAELGNPRTKCWRVSVPFKFKDYIMSDLAYPMGWCHRPFYPPKQKSKEETDAEQLAKRNRQENNM